MKNLINKIKEIIKQDEKNLVELIPFILEKNMPLMELTPLEETWVNTPTREYYNELMRIYEIGGWKGGYGHLPTIKLKGIDFMKEYKEKTCIEAKDRPHYCNIDYAINKNYRVISKQEFYEIQKITPEMLKEINSFYKNRARRKIWKILK